MKELQDILTPSFVLSEERLLSSIKLIKESLAVHWPNSVLSYSVKTNSWLELLRILSRQNVWAEVVSDFEFRLASKCGFGHGNFVCNGASKSDDYIRMALDTNSLLHLDSISEIEQLLRIVNGAETTFGVRINATEPDFDAEPLSGPLNSRFGLSIRDGDIERLTAILAAHKNLHLTSLHLHCNTSSRGLNGYKCLVRLFAKVVKLLPTQQITTFDIGGSFGHDFDHPEDGSGHWPSWNEYLSGIASTLIELGFSPNKLRLVIEPGVSLIGGCADYYTTIVGERYFNGMRVLQMDGSRIHVDPFVARKTFAGTLSLCTEHDQTNQTSAKYVGGCTCLEKDRVELPEGIAQASLGDQLCFNCAGAYTYGLSPICFIQSAPAVYVKHINGDLELSQFHLSADEISSALTKRNRVLEEIHV